MASDSRENSQRVEVVHVANEEVQQHLLKVGYNIDFGGASFREADLERELNQSTSSSSTSTTSGATGGVQHSQTEFVDDGKANILDMLNPSLVVTISVKDSEREASKEENTGREQEL